MAKKVLIVVAIVVALFLLIVLLQNAITGPTEASAGGILTPR